MPSCTSGTPATSLAYEPIMSSSRAALASMSERMPTEVSPLPS